MHFLKVLLLVAFPVLKAQTIPKIEGCQVIDAYWVDCWWRNSQSDQETTKFMLTYTSEWDPPHSRPTYVCTKMKVVKNSEGNVEEHCYIPKARQFGVYLLHLTAKCTDSSNSSPNCTIEGETFPFKCTVNHVILRQPPGELRLISNNTKLVWKEPRVNDSFLPSIFFTKEIKKKYKVVYKLVKSSLKEVQPGDEWEVWYIGKRRSYVLKHLLPDSHYQAKVYAAIVINENGKRRETWSNATLPIDIFTLPPIINPVKNILTTTTAAVINSESSGVLKNQMLIAPVFVGTSLLLIVLFLVFRKKCSLPTKIKLPKPVIMLSPEEWNMGDYISDHSLKEDERSPDPVILEETRLQDPGQRIQAVNCASFDQAKPIRLIVESVTEDCSSSTPLMRNGLSNTPCENRMNQNSISLEDGNTRNSSDTIILFQQAHVNESGGNKLFSPNVELSKSTGRLSDNNSKISTAFSQESVPRLGQKFPSDRKESSGSLDNEYVLESSVNPETIDLLPKKKLEQLLIFCATDGEKLPDYVQQSDCFSGNHGYNLVMQVTTSMPTVAAGDNEYHCDCAKSAGVQILTCNGLLKPFCPHCKNDLAERTGPQEGAIEGVPKDVVADASSFERSFSSDTSSLDSGYSHETNAST